MSVGFYYVMTTWQQVWNRFVYNLILWNKHKIAYSYEWIKLQFKWIKQTNRFIQKGWLVGVLEWYGFGFPDYVLYLNTCPSQSIGDHLFTKQLLFFYEFYVNKTNILLSYNIYKFYFITAPRLFNSTMCTKSHYLLVQKRIILISLLYHMFWYFHSICLTSVHIICTLAPQQIILVCRALNFSKLNLSRLYILNICYSLHVPIFYKRKYDQIICLLALYVSIWMSNK